MHPVLFHIGSILIPSYGAVTALGVLLALFLSERTARVAGLDSHAIWNLWIASIFAALVASRFLLIALNWTALRLHPAWLLGLAMIHHPLLGAFGAGTGVATTVFYGRKLRLPLGPTADALAAPVALGLAFEQLGALLSGSGFGTPTTVRWAVTYTNPLAMRWSGVPLGIALHPVQGYAALAFVALAMFLWTWLPFRHQQGDLIGFFMLGAGVAIFFTEFWRDPEGRGELLSGALDGPQIAAVALVVAAGLVLRKRNGLVEEEAANG